MLEILDIAAIGSIFVTLFVIVDPPGIVPVFLALTSSRGTDEMPKLARQAVLTSLVVITLFAVVGDQLLRYLHISLPAMQGAGGLLLLLVSLQLLTGTDPEPTATRDVNIALVPLGVPLLAGPGAIVATILFARDAQSSPELLALAIAIFAVHIVLWASMRYSTAIAKALGRSGITILTRISGLLLAAIAVQLIADAVKGFVAA